MNYLIAKVNDRKEKYRTVIADNTVFYSLPINLKKSL